MSGVMETRDRWLVADNPVSFDSDFMVFVSPPPAEISKATSPIKPFTQTVGHHIYFASLILNTLDVAFSNHDSVGILGKSYGNGLHNSCNGQRRG